MTPGLRARPPRQPTRDQHGELRIDVDDVGREAREELASGSALSAERKCKPALREQASGEAPVLGRLGMADRRERIAVRGEPVRRGVVQRWEFIGRGTPQLELEKVRE